MCVFQPGVVKINGMLWPLLFWELKEEEWLCRGEHAQGALGRVSVERGAECCNMLSPFLPPSFPPSTLVSWDRANKMTRRLLTGEK